ncbi:hypothetical protein POVWA1_005740 [Plasmodium ovale wallikeri]|uniref:Uncharacterized protein n=1 Tax=Plasmodium ovale wallikeri TaxID=864142 RepID=A0A1A8YHW9_PLAOA|nr:hypothetical protein POVWA1_005740 [Plasmodium ovale wallikeri]
MAMRRDGRKAKTQHPTCELKGGTTRSKNELKVDEAKGRGAKKESGKNHKVCTNDEHRKGLKQENGVTEKSLDP